MTVENFMSGEKITKDHVCSISGESDYWTKASNFILDNWEEQITDLTERQYRWLDSLRDDLTEKRIQGKI